MKTLALPALLFAAFAALPTSAQDPSRDGAKVFEADEIVMRYFKSKHVDGRKLLEALGPFHARNLFVRTESDGPPQLVGNMSLLGDVVVLYDTPEKLDRIVNSMIELEAAVLAESGEQNDSGARASLVTHEYTPGYVTIQSLHDALRPYVRLLREDELDPGTYRESPPNVNFLEDPPRILIRDTAEGVERILAVVRSVDRPLTQVMITAYLVSPSGTFANPSSVPLPEELATNLVRLTPYEAFDTMALSGLRLNVGQGGDTTLAMGGPSSAVGDFSLVLGGLAYDPANGALSLSRASLQRRRNGKLTTVLNTTFTTYRGEYAVVGLIGDQPLLLAITFEVISEPRREGGAPEGDSRRSKL